MTSNPVDPAFLMEPVQPKEEMNIEDDAIGLTPALDGEVCYRRRS